ncbi:MAG: autotransporter-associated beta strand repeat-containing protein, partial [Verrucomicrobiota bacterium]
TFILANGDKALTKDGAGNVVLGAPNTYVGATTINAGTLTYGVGNALAGGPVTIHNGTLDMAAYDDTVGAVTLREGSIAGAGTLTSTSGFTLNNNASASISVNLAGNVGLTKNGSGSATISGSNIYTGPTTLNAGTLTTGVAGSIPNNSAVLMGTDSSARLDLNGCSTQIGSLSGGCATGGGIALGAADLTVGGGASDSATYYGVISGTGGVVKTGAGTQTLSAYNNYTGVTRIDGGVLNAAWRLTHGGTASSLGAASNAAANLVFGGGTLQYTGAGTAVTDRLFTLGDANGDTATLDASGTTELASLTFSNTNAIAFGDDNAHTLTLTGAHAGNNMFATAIGDNTGLTSVVKNGPGTWVLTGANTYGGTTTVSAGKLLVSNATGSGTGTGTVNVVASGTLGGTGAISGALNVSGVLAPGSSIGVLTSATLTLANNSTYQYQVNSSIAPALGADLHIVNGALALGGTVTLSLTDLGVGTFASGTVFSLFNYSGGWNNGIFTYNSSTLNDDSTFSFSGKAWTIDYNATTKGTNVAGTEAGHYVNITKGIDGAPEIAISQGGDISTGGSKGFGFVKVGTSGSLTFTISNFGNASLDLTGTPSVAVTGDTDFTVTQQPSASVAGAGGTTDFTVTFTPTVAGARSASIHITNNDANEGAFTVNLTGTGATAYDLWAQRTNLTGLPGSDTDPAFDADPDHDGVKNGLEWILGGNPTQDDARAILPRLGVSNGTLTLAFTREKSSIGETALVVEYGGDLAWSKSVIIGEVSAPQDANGVAVVVTTGDAPD